MRVPGLSGGPRRTDHQYDKTDLFLLGGGALLVLLGLALAADSWFSTKGAEEPQPAFAASADSTRARFLRRGPADSAAPDTVTIPTVGLRDAVPGDSTTTVTATASVSAATPQIATSEPPAPPPTVGTGATAPAAGTTAPAAAKPVPVKDTARVPAASNPARTTPASPPAAARDIDAGTPTWSVQAGVFGARTNADRLAATLTAMGYTPRIVQTGTLYRVRATGFATRAEAVEAQTNISEAAGAQAVLIPPQP